MHVRLDTCAVPLVDQLDLIGSVVNFDFNGFRREDCQRGADGPLMPVVRHLSGGPPHSPKAMNRTYTMALLLAAGLVFVTISGARADDDDHEFARRALEQGRALPLADILAKVTPRVPGKVIEVELEVDDGTLVYDLKVLTPQGRLQEIEVDAATGKILEIEDDD